jgi:hypothetical protein
MCLVTTKENEFILKSGCITLYLGLSQLYQMCLAATKVKKFILIRLSQRKRGTGDNTQQKTHFLGPFQWKTNAQPKMHF